MDWSACRQCKGSGYVAYSAAHDLDVECLACIDRWHRETEALERKSVRKAQPQTFARSTKRAEGES